MSPNPTESSGTVLLIEDKEKDINEIKPALEKEGFTVNVATSARDAFTSIFKSAADLIILDINLPDLDGFHVAKELKRNMMLRHIPVIILSTRVDFLEKMKNLDVIVDEYLVKPFQLDELVVRSKLVLQRAISQLDANPLTRLPGNMAIVKKIKEKINSGKPFAVGYGDLNNFKAYNDKYGFNKGDQILKLTAQMIVNALGKVSPNDHFVGHVGGDDFIFVCAYEKANDVCQAITETFDKQAPMYYSEEDRKKGYITVEDRRGVVSQFPICSIAIGMVSDEGKKFSNLGQINHSLTQLKKYAKSFQGSAFVRDRRSLEGKLAEFTWGPGSSASQDKVLENITKALGTYLPDSLKDILDKKKINVLFQPILDMMNDEVMAHESLVRGPVGSPLEYPDALFQTARTASLVPQLDQLCIERIISAAQEFHRGIKLFINVFPETLLDEAAFERDVLNLIKVKDCDLVVELSGSHRANDANLLFSRLMKLKEAGLKVCMDSNVVLQGQGISYLAELRPQYIKLNMMHYKDMNADHKKKDEFIKTVSLIRQAGSEVICTKLESRADSFFALKTGVQYGQGFLFARATQPSTPSPVK